MNVARKRSGFTLVELLVVIGIIGLLAAIITPVVMQSLTKARNAAIKAEIDMLHMAIMNYKNEYGSFPPCFDANPAAPLTSGSMTSVAQKHVARLFPRCTTISGPAGQFQNSVPLNPANALVAWLRGFSADPLQPVLGTPKAKLFDFDESRIASLDNTSAATLANTRFVYFPSGKQRSPYLYINNAFYGSKNANGSVNTPTEFTPPVTYVGSFPNTTAGSMGLIPALAGVFRPELQELPNGTFYFNTDSFQILCAGRDEVFGTDDDLSNFWPGTRREYLDSLKD